MQQHESFAALLIARCTVGGEIRRPAKGYDGRGTPGKAHPFIAFEPVFAGALRGNHIYICRERQLIRSIELEEHGERDRVDEQDVKPKKHSFLGS
jgi:hypothetical protein